MANRKVRKTVILSVGFIIFLFLRWFVGLFSTPAHYRVVEPLADKQPSRYLTNYILPQLHNKSQYDQPFEIVFSQQGINDVIARHVDFNSLQHAGLSNLSVAFKRGRILFIGKTAYYGFDFLVTIVLKPHIDKEGRFFLEVSKVQAGNSRVPFISETVKEKILAGFNNPLNSSEDSGFIKALFGNSGIEPVFSINRNKIRIEKMTVRDGELIVHFLPWQDK